VNAIVHSTSFKVMLFLFAGYMGYQCPNVVAWLFDSEVTNPFVFIPSFILCFMVGIGMSEIGKLLRAKYPLE
jgi:hypothetical protein